MRKLKALIVTAVLSLTMSFSAFAGQWNQDSNGWWYQNDNGTYPVSGWQWIDGDGNGVSECYYFNENGYILSNTITPDGQTVDSNGAWIVDGKLQTKAASKATDKTTTSNNNNTAANPTQSTTQSAANTNNKEQMVWVSRTGTKYHSNPNCSNMKEPSHKTLSEAEGMGRTPCSKCY